MRTILLLVIALGAAASAAFGARSWLNAERTALNQARPEVTASKPAFEGVEILVSDRNLEPGMFVREGDLRWQSWPAENVNAAYLIKQPDKATKQVGDYIGAVPTRSIPAGQPIYPALLVSPGERGFLAAVLNPGMRAVTLPVDATRGLAGLVLPGDQVDLILSRDLDVYEGRRQHLSQTVLADVRVLAVDQKLSGFDPEDSKVEETAKSRSMLPAKTVTIEVTPKQAEKVTLALAMGNLALSLRSIVDDPGELIPAGYTEDSVFPTPNRPKAPREGELGRDQSVTVMRGAPAGSS